MELIEKGKIQILKGNISELLAIAGQRFTEQVLMPERRMR